MALSLYMLWELSMQEEAACCCCMLLLHAVAAQFLSFVHQFIQLVMQVTEADRMGKGSVYADTYEKSELARVSAAIHAVVSCKAHATTMPSVCYYPAK